MKNNDKLTPWSDGSPWRKDRRWSPKSRTIIKACDEIRVLKTEWRSGDLAASTRSRMLVSGGCPCLEVALSLLQVFCWDWPSIPQNNIDQHPQKFLYLPFKNYIKNTNSTKPFWEYTHTIATGYGVMDLFEIPLKNMGIDWLFYE